MSKKPEHIAYGIDELVARLQTEGVEQAQDQSKVILAQAEQKAQKILADADTQSDKLLTQAREKIQTERRAAEDDLKVAYRDMVLDLKNHLLSRFAQDVERLVSESLHSDEVIKQLVVAAGNKILSPADITPGDQLPVTLPDDVLELEDIIKDPAAGSAGTLAEFVFAQQRCLLEQGIEFKRGDQAMAGIKIGIEGKQISVDLTDQAIASMLLTYLNPRFRALLDGIIH